MAADERHAQGAHFTSQADIAKVAVPAIATPWRERLAAGGSIAELERVLGDMFSYRVLNPACGSGLSRHGVTLSPRLCPNDPPQLIVRRDGAELVGLASQACWLRSTAIRRELYSYFVQQR